MTPERRRLTMQTSSSLEEPEASPAKIAATLSFQISWFGQTAIATPPTAFFSRFLQAISSVCEFILNRSLWKGGK
jgi:hypothetical protein